MFALRVNADSPEFAGDDPEMVKSAQQILKENLQTLMAQPGAPRTQGEIAKRAKFDQTTAGRILGMKNAPSIDKLDGLARAFNVAPWELLLPGLDPRLRRPASFSPLALELATLYQALPADRQAALYAVAEAMHNPHAVVRPQQGAEEQTTVPGELAPVAPGPEAPPGVPPRT